MSSLAKATRDVTRVLFFAALPLALNLAIYTIQVRQGYGVHFGFDFHVFWQAGRDLLAGHSPYPPPHAWALTGEDQFVYPAPVAVLAIPLSILPFAVAATVFAALLALLVPATLWVLGVRDWRCYGLAFLWPPVVSGIGLGAISIVLAFALAVAWRYRDRRWIGPLALGAAVTAKVFLWPLFLWLLATRRIAATGRAVALTLVVTIGAWAAIGFDGLRDYPRLLNALADLLQRKGYSLTSLGIALDLSPGEARAVSLVAGAAALAAIAVVARRGEGDRRGFVVALAAAFILSPIVWMHYLALLFVPLAITRPRLSAIWLAPLLLWGSEGQSHGTLWRIALGLVVSALVLGASGVMPASRSMPTRGFRVPARLSRTSARSNRFSASEPIG